MTGMIGMTIVDRYCKDCRYVVWGECPHIEAGNMRLSHCERYKEECLFIDSGLYDQRNKLYRDLEIALPAHYSDKVHAEEDDDSLDME